MRDEVKVNSVVEFVRALGPGRIAAMGAVAAGLIGFFIFLMLRLSEPQMAVLFSDLAFEDSLNIVKKLEASGVKHEVRQNGAVIMAPSDRVLRLRMQMAEDGLPTGGAVGYEIFDNGSSLSATSFVQNINRLRALEGELARAIRTLDRIQAARVKLVLPERKLFSRKTAEPKASIVVKTRGDLTAGQIRAIQHLVASAVQDLNPNRVSIVDETGHLLASGRGDSDTESAIDTEERNRKFEDRMAREIETIVASVVGEDGARVRVTAELDYNKVTETSEVYDPDGQVVRSTQTRQESSSSSQPGGDNGVTVGNELPSADADANSSGSNREAANKSEEVINYEISRKQRTEIVEAGRIKRISVAVLVDGIYAKDKDGKLQYSPRPQEQLDKISALVRTAIGYDQTRNDQVNIVNMQFTVTEGEQLADAEGGFFGITFSKGDYFRIAELTVLFLVTMLVLLFVIRPLVRRIIAPEEQEQNAQLSGPDGQPLPQLTGPDGQPVEGGEDLPQLEGPKAANPMQDILDQAKQSGELQTSTMKEVGVIVKNNPEEAVTVLRQWMSEEAA